MRSSRKAQLKEDSQPVVEDGESKGVACLADGRQYPAPAGLCDDSSAFVVAECYKKGQEVGLIGVNDGEEQVTKGVKKAKPGSGEAKSYNTTP